MELEGRRIWKEGGFGKKEDLEGRKEDLVRRLEANLEDILSLFTPTGAQEVTLSVHLSMLFVNSSLNLHHSDSDLQAVSLSYLSSLLALF